MLIDVRQSYVIAELFEYFDPEIPSIHLTSVQCTAVAGVSRPCYVTVQPKAERDASCVEVVEVLTGVERRFAVAAIKQIHVIDTRHEYDHEVPGPFHALSTRFGICLETYRALSKRPNQRRFGRITTYQLSSTCPICSVC